MTKQEPFSVGAGNLILINAVVTGRHRKTVGRFVLDTGAVATTLIPELADALGYNARDGDKRTRVRTAVGCEEGYTLRVAELTVLGFSMPDFWVNVFDLGHDNIDGLLGLNFLRQFNYHVRSAEKRILIERVAS